MPEIDHDFFVRRAQDARNMAAKAADPGIRAIHERMATDYAELAKLSGGPTLQLVTDDNAQDLSSRSASRS